MGRHKDVKTELFNSIKSKALEHHGAAFSFEYSYVTKTKHYSKNLFNRWHTGIADAFENLGDKRDPLFIKMCVPDGVTVSIEEKILRDGRKAWGDNPTATASVDIGNVATISVPKELSYAYYYEYYARDGYAFCNHLVENRQDILAKIHGFNSGRSCYITTNCICDDLSNDGRWAGFHYSEIGMAPLSNVAQCYGLLLAILAKYNLSVDDYILSEREGSIRVEKRHIPKPEPALQSW